MPLTPQITLTATLLDYSGAALGTAATPAYLRIALAGYRGVLPCVPGTAMVGKVTSWPGDIPYVGTQLTVPLWGNDVITPAGTWYSISVLDANKNVLQTAAYQFTGTQTIDLSNATPIVPNPPTPSTLQYLPCTGAVPGTAYVAPGQVLMVFYNGVALTPGGLSLPTLSYTLTAGTQIALNFTTETGDLIYALCFA